MNRTNNLSVESVRLRAEPGGVRSAARTTAHSNTLLPAAWAWLVCPTVFLLSNVPLLNLYARAILGAYIAWFALSVLLGRRRLILPVMPVVLIFWTFFALAISLLAVDPYLAIRKWLTVVTLGAMGLAVTHSVYWSGSPRSWGWAYILSALAAYISNYLPLEQYIVTDYQTEIMGRFVGTLANANAFGRAMVEAFFAGMILLLVTPRGWKAFVVILIMGGLGLATIESSSRTAMLGLGGGVIAFYYSVRPRDLFKPLNLLGLLGVMLGILAVFTYFPARFYAAIHRFEIVFAFLGLTPGVETGERSIEGRVDLASRAIEVWLQNPLGVGLDNFRTFGGTYAHSNYLEILVSTGIIGLVIYYLPFAVFVRQQFTHQHRAGDQAWCRYVISVFLCIALMDVFSISYYSKTFWILIGLISGFAALLNQGAVRMAAQRH